jgi:ribosomal protein S18 acetylase RimI-like enzyme
MSSIQVVQLKPEEWPAYKALRLEALQTAPQAFGSAYADNLKHPDTFWQRRLQAAADDQPGWLLFAQAEDRLVGMIGAYGDSDPAVVHIISTYITPAYRGQGIGQALMRAILDAVRQPGTFQTARLTVNVQQIPALRLYEQFGFQTVATERAPMGDGLLYDEYIMEKRLSIGA